MKKNKKIMIPLLACLFVVGFSKIVFADTYNITIPVLNGANTGSIRKTDGTADYGFNWNTSTGGGYQLTSYLRRQDTGKQITEEDSFSSGGWSKMSFGGTGSWYRGYDVCMHIYSGFNVAVRVQTQGSWTPDYK